MSKKQLQDDETLRLVYRARLDRLNDKKVEVVFDPNGPFQIMQPPTGTLVRYFTPERQEGIDPYGNDTANQLNKYLCPESLIVKHVLCKVMELKQE